MEKSELSQSDHDILITLVETVKNNQVSLLEKMESVKTDTEELKNGISLKLADHENRIRSLEQLRDEIRPKEMVKIITSNNKWISEFTFTWKIVVAIAAIVGGVVGFLLSVASDLMGMAMKR